MTEVRGEYHKVPSDGGDSQHMSNRRWSKVGATLLGGSCFVLFLVVATLFSSPTLHGPNAADSSTSLFGFAKSMRAPAPVLNAPAWASPAVGQFPSMTSVSNQGTFLAPGFQPVFPNLDQSRIGNRDMKAFFGNFFKGTRDEKFYKKTEWKTGDKADFFSISKRGWIPCVITDSSDQGVMVDVKPGFWITKPNQATKLRKRFSIKGYATNKGKDLDLPTRGAQLKQKELIEKQKDLERQKDLGMFGGWR